MFIEFINKIDFKELKDFITITFCPEIKNFEPNNRYIFDIKANVKEINMKAIYGLNRKGKELQEALMKQNYFKNKEKIGSVIILDHVKKVKELNEKIKNLRKEYGNMEETIKKQILIILVGRELKLDEETFLKDCEEIFGEYFIENKNKFINLLNKFNNENN